jgi:hypothetical protein
MSLKSLPTELDVKIAGFLVNHPHDLTSLMRVSKTYRIVAEPILYEHIRVFCNDHVTLRLLLLQLIRRPTLASKIKFITATYNRTINEALRNEAPSTNQELALKQESWDIALDIRDQINLIMCEQPITAESIELKNILFGMLYADPTKYLTHFSCASFALIILMAKNLQSLRTCQPSWALRTMLKFPWVKAANRPLGKLTSSCLCTCDMDCGAPAHAILPSTEHLKFMNTHWHHNYQSIIHQQLEPNTPVLETIHFQSIGARGGPTFFTYWVQAPIMVNLKQFVVQDYTTHEEYQNWEMQALIGSLARYAPKLEVFEWTNRLESTTTWFGMCYYTFQGLKCLRRLTVDFNHVAPTQSWSDIVDNFRVCFPDSLESLTIDNVGAGEVDKYVDSVRTLNHNENTAMVHAAKAMAANFPLKYLRINICMKSASEIARGYDYYNKDPHADLESIEDENSSALETWELRSETVEFFSLVAEELKATNTHFEVFRMPKVFKGFSKLLLRN